MKKPSLYTYESSHPASAVLRATIAAADKLGHLHRQHFVIRETPSLPRKIMKPAPPPASEQPATDKDASRPGFPWEDSSGEGAASALESLRKLEQTRSDSQPAEDKPAAE